MEEMEREVRELQAEVARLRAGAERQERRAEEESERLANRLLRHVAEARAREEAALQEMEAEEERIAGVLQRQVAALEAERDALQHAAPAARRPHVLCAPAAPTSEAAAPVAVSGVEYVGGAESDEVNRLLALVATLQQRCDGYKARVSALEAVVASLQQECLRFDAAQRGPDPLWRGTIACNTAAPEHACLLPGGALVFPASGRTVDLATAAPLAVDGCSLSVARQPLTLVLDSPAAALQFRALLSPE